MSANKRVVVLLSEGEYVELKRRAGIASMSAYIKAQIFPVTILVPSLKEAFEPGEVLRMVRGAAEKASVEGVARAAPVVAERREPEVDREAIDWTGHGGREIEKPSGKCHYMAKPGSKCPACRKVHED